MNVGELPLRHSERWSRATRHAFVEAVRDGTLPESQFDTWLAQDYLFVVDLLRFQARLLARAPRSAQAVLAAGAAALVDELAWFERQAAVRRIDLDGAPLPATRAYRQLLDRLDRADFATALVCLWTLERTYLDAWSYAAPGAEPYQAFVAHWTTAEFAAYVSDLEGTVDSVGEAVADLDARFIEVVEAEIQFWDMAIEATP